MAGGVALTGKPEVVLFDLDDTLFAHRASVEAAAAVTLRAMADVSEQTLAAEVARWNDPKEHHSPHRHGLLIAPR